MADINVKLKLDSREAELRVEELKKKAEQLKAKLASGLLPPEAMKATANQLKQINTEIVDLQKNTDIVKTADDFGNFADTLGAVNVGLAGAAISLEVFNDGTEEFAQLQRRFNLVLQTGTVLQQVANIESVKAKINKVQEAIATRLTIKAKTTEAGVTKGLTVVQKLWNKAVAANPILVLVAAITALIGIGAALIKFFDKSTEQAKDYEKALDGTVIKNDELLIKRQVKKLMN
jgi:hypothetical protein